MNPLRLLSLAALLAAPLAAAAEEAPAGEAAQEEAPKVVFSGLVDAYYTLNLTQAQTVANPLRAYDGLTGFNLSWAKLGATMAPEPVGFRIDLGFGPESTYTTQDYVLQAYASAKLGPGVLDFGLFTTSAGFELFESNSNWLYTRGLLYQWVEPTSHQGARYTADVGGGLTLQGSLTNGWETPGVGPGGSVVPDEILRASSPYKTGSLSAFYAGDAVSGAVNVYFGKQVDTRDNRLLLDGNVGYALGALETNLSAAYRVEGDQKALGANLSARFALSDALKVAARFEILKFEKYLQAVDGGLPEDGKAWNVTAGVIHPIGTNLEMRAEVRYDKFDSKIFEKTETEAEVADASATAHFAVLAWF